jgi:hypothetical protein
VKLRDVLNEAKKKNKGLWHNIHAKRKRGEKPAKPGSKDYPKSLDIDEAEYQGREVKLNKPTQGDVKKSKVYVNSGKKNKDGTMKISKVNFGHGGKSAKSKGEKTMIIKKDNPDRRKSFRARHNCDNPGPKTKARYWSCKAW